MWALYGLTILGGIGNGLQPGLNSTWRSTLGQSIVAAFVSVIGTILALSLAGHLPAGFRFPKWNVGRPFHVGMVRRRHGSRADPRAGLRRALNRRRVVPQHYGCNRYADFIAARPLRPRWLQGARAHAGRIAGAALIVGGSCWLQTSDPVSRQLPRGSRRDTGCDHHQTS